MKNKDINNKPALILVFAAIFLIGGIAGLIAAIGSKSEDKTLFLVITILLIVIGVVFVVYGSIRAKKITDRKKLLNDPNAFVTEATFIGAKMSSYSSSMTTVAGIPVSGHMSVYKKVIYEYVDENGVKRTAKSNLSYFPKQIEYLKNLNKFKIKCKGNISEIIEEVPEVNSKINL